MRAIMKLAPSRVLRIGTVLVVLALVAGGVAVFVPGSDTKRVVAYFGRTVGLYEGNDVRVLGVRVGTVTAIQPQGTKVRVEMTYDAARQVPADAKAVVVSPTLVSDRYVQLAPVYKRGPVLDDGATIPRSRTGTPVELDRVYGALNNLSKSLGPEGANKDGSLSRLLKVSANTLEGQGDNVHKTVENLSQATQTLADGGDDLFATVRNLQQFTTALAESDEQVEAFNQNLADVSAQLEGEREELAAALKHLATALEDVEKFVRKNKGSVAKNVDDLAEITKVLVKEKEALAGVLHKAPLAVSNLALAYNPVAGTLDVRNDFQQVQNPAMYICSLVYSLGVPPKQCEPILSPLNILRQRNLPVSLDLSFLTRLTHSTKPYKYPSLREAMRQGGGGDRQDQQGQQGQQGQEGQRGQQGQKDQESQQGQNAPQGQQGEGEGRQGQSPAPSPALVPDSSLEEMLAPGGNT